ncbi:MAG: AI-2E family transporter [Terriglobales bacterium]
MSKQFGLTISPTLQFLLGGACTVIILCGVRAAAPVLGPVLLGLLLAYALVPFPRWLIRRFRFPKSAAIAVTAAAVVASGLFLAFSMDLATVLIEVKLPVYEQRLSSVYEQAENVMSARGLGIPIHSVKSALTPEQLREITEAVLTVVRTIVSDLLLIWLLAFLFIVEMTDSGINRSALAARLAYYRSDAETYVAVTARSAGINALVNLAFLLAMGVDTPVLWSVLYFFLDFIPTLGFLLALVPPTFVTLLMFGWKKALVVACGLILTNLIVDNLVTPMFMKQAVNVSFLEITLSLVGWAFLLGLTGAIVAIPMTLALKKFVAKTLRSEEPATEPSG